MRRVRVLWLLLCIAPLLMCCLDEDKTGCRSDGDCRGVRVCVSGVCETPSDAPDVGSAGVVEGGEGVRDGGVEAGVD